MSFVRQAPSTILSRLQFSRTKGQNPLNEVPYSWVDELVVDTDLVILMVMMLLMALDLKKVTFRCSCELAWRNTTLSVPWIG